MGSNSHGTWRSTRAQRRFGWESGRQLHRAGSHVRTGRGHMDTCAGCDPLVKSGAQHLWCHAAYCWPGAGRGRPDTADGPPEQGGSLQGVQSLDSMPQHKLEP